MNTRITLSLKPEEMNKLTALQNVYAQRFATPRTTAVFVYRQALKALLTDKDLAKAVDAEMERISNATRQYPC
jgi:tRNA threonylcarbamoyladenosine modification (KEOPS) complex Cgi121 subunit